MKKHAFNKPISLIPQHNLDQKNNIGINLLVYFTHSRVNPNLLFFLMYYSTKTAALVTKKLKNDIQCFLSGRLSLAGL